MPTVSCVLTFHREGSLARSTLASLKRCIDLATGAGLTCETLAVLDRADGLTSQTVAEHPWAKVIETDAGDPATARNAGIRAASGEYVTTLDGDDYYGANWIVAAHAHAQSSPDAILHPEYVCRFGEEESFHRQLSMDEASFSQGMFLMYNPWSLWSFARVGIFLAHPFEAVDGGRDGFGYEDWHWHCETLAAGTRHELVHRTCGFYRRRSTGVFSREHGSRAMVRRSALFDILPGGNGA